MINQYRFDYVEGEVKGVISYFNPNFFVQHVDDDWKS